MAHTCRACGKEITGKYLIVCFLGARGYRVIAERSVVRTLICADHHRPQEGSSGTSHGEDLLFAIVPGSSSLDAPRETMLTSGDFDMTWCISSRELLQAFHPGLLVALRQQAPTWHRSYAHLANMVADERRVLTDDDLAALVVKHEAAEAANATAEPLPSSVLGPSVALSIG